MTSPLHPLNPRPAVLMPCEEEMHSVDLLVAVPPDDNSLVCAEPQTRVFYAM